MDRRTRTAYKLRYEQKEYQQREAYAIRIVEKAFDKFNKPYLAFSGGKDSVAMLYCALQVEPDIPVWIWDHGEYLIPRRLQNEIENNALKMGVKKKNLHVHTSPELQEPEARWDYMRWYRGFFGTLHRLISKYDWDVALIGIRQQEGIARKLRAEKPFNYSIDRNCPQCYPVHRFTAEDVWACIVGHDLPYLSYYDLYSRFHGGYEDVRFCTFFDREFQEYNAVDGILMSEFKNK